MSESTLIHENDLKSGKGDGEKLGDSVATDETGELPATDETGELPATDETGKTGGGSMKKGGKKSGKKSRKMNAGARDWVKLVMDVFKKNRAKNPSYKYKQAMKDAAKLKKKNNKTKKA